MNLWTLVDYLMYMAMKCYQTHPTGVHGWIEEIKFLFWYIYWGGIIKYDDFRIR